MPAPVAPAPSTAIKAAASTEAPEDLVRVEAIRSGTYPDYDDPRREMWYAIFRQGRTATEPGSIFRMRRKDLESAVHGPGNPEGWVRVLTDQEHAAIAATVPATADARARQVRPR